MFQPPTQHAKSGYNPAMEKAQNPCMRGRTAALLLTLITPLWLPGLAAAHGGVVLDDDICLINVGFYQAHFTVFQPGSRKHQQFCEDLPDLGESIFVLEYLHDGLGELGVDFRVVRNVTGMGRFAAWQDIENITDLDAITVFYQPRVYEPDVFAVLHDFSQPGEFIGVVTAQQPGGKLYTAVFPFEVGFEIDDYADYVIYVVGIGALLAWVGPMLYRRFRGRGGLHAAGAWPLLLILPLGAAVLTPPLLQAAAAGQPNDPTAAQVKPIKANGEFFTAELIPGLQPLRINKMHSWHLRLATLDGTPLNGAQVTVAGGMPAHDHGLPTAPRALPLETPGAYQLRGVKFHMHGAWQLELQISAQGKVETLILPFQV